jgi:hypothetical protein
MSFVSVGRVLGLSLLAAVAACTPGIVPEPGGRPAPTPPPPPPPPRAAQPQAGQDLADWIVTPGTWTYVRDSRAATARFGVAGAAPVAWLRCDLATRAVSVGRIAGASGTSAMMAVTTSFGRSDWPARAGTGGMEAQRAAADPGLDAIAFSRGRFALGLVGGAVADAPVVLPSWAEPVRVIEDCRG